MEHTLDKYLFHEGKNFHAYEFLGSFLEENQCTFRVWAPHAQQVFVTGDFCGWNPTAYELTRITNEGIFEGIVPNVHSYDAYKYVIKTSDGRMLWKSDPYARHAQTRPETASKVYENQNYSWNDENWVKNRTIPYQQPLNIYEVHLGSWKHGENGGFCSYRQIADTLIPYVKQMHYTHIELLPITEYPYDPSWGYQVTGYFAVTSRYGTPDDFKYLIDKAHQNGIGVILDWVPGHFTKDEFGLYEFDGQCCYEYSDERKKEHKSWGTRVFDYGRGEVCSFLFSSANYWIEEFHLDGLRVDAVSSMLFLNYDRPEHLAAKNIYGGNENLEVLDFFKTLNQYVRENYPGVMMIAEESSSGTKITGMRELGGLGFDYKWNMGWMNDILRFYEEDPIYRKYDFNLVTFSFMYAFSENFLLPFSHDEVVHGKKSLMHKMWGDRYNQFAGLRNLLTYQICHPGKKLLFMGSEFGQFLEWKSEEQLEWSNLDDQMNKKMQGFTAALNAFYKDNRPLWEIDLSYDGIEIIDADNTDQSVLSFIRKTEKGDMLVCVFNMAPVERKNFTIGVPVEAIYEEVWNTELEEWGGVWKEHNETVQSQEGLWKDYPQTLTFTLPALGASIWKIKRRIKSKSTKNKK